MNSNLVAVVFRFTLIFLLSCVVITTTTPVAQAQSYDSARKILEADKQVSDYQAAKAGGYSFIYDDTSTGETVVKVIVSIGLLGIISIWFYSLERKYKHAIGWIVVMLVGLIGFMLLIQKNKESQAQEERDKEAAFRNTTIEAYKTVFKENAEPIQRLFNGDDPRFLAGEDSFEQLRKIPGMEDDEIFNSKYSQLKCTKPCIGMIFPENHPIAAGLSDAHFYYCKTKTKGEILTGFGFSYNEYHNLAQYEAVKAGLLDASIIATPYVTVNKDRKMTYIDSPGTLSNVDVKTLGKGKGLSIIWNKVGDKNGKDLCGNSSFAP